MIVELSIGKLAEYIEEFYATTLIDNIEIDVGNLGIVVPAVDNTVQVNCFIKKYNLPMVELSFDNGYTIKVAKNHILQSSGSNIYAKNVAIGDKLDHLAGSVAITSIRHIGNEDCYDISIPAPHLYCDANGLIHHNTVITAALSNAVSPYGRSIVIVPNKSLVTQTEKDYVNMEQDVGVYFGDRKEWGRQHTICTWQSLNVLLKNTKAGVGDCTIGEFLEDVSCVIVDECFAEDSQVLTPTGYKPIRDIKSGDKVVNYSETTKEFKVDTVVKQHKNLTNSVSEPMFELEFDNGNKIHVTGNHKFLTDQGWVRADALTEDHKIINKI